MKKCQFCAEEVQEEAVVCRYCGRDLVEQLKTPEIVEPQRLGAIPLESVIAQFVSNGYQVTMQNKDGAQLSKKKRFPALLLVIAFIALLFNIFVGLGVLGLALIVYLLGKDQSAYLTKAANGTVTSTDQDGYKKSYIMQEELTLEERQAGTKDALRKLLIPLGIVLIVIVLAYALR